MNKNPDFSGWATRHGVLCADGRVIAKDAFKHCDGITVPLVWNHNHDNVHQVLGHAVLRNRDEGVYADCYLNDSDSGLAAKTLVEHGDIKSLSVFANNLKQSGATVLHGIIRELSMVLAGANPEANIETIALSHGLYDADDCTVMNFGEPLTNTLSHAAAETDDKKDKTLAEIIETMNEEQKTALYGAVGAALAESKADRDEETEDTYPKHDDIKYGKKGETMKHNIFDGETLNSDNENTLTHDAMRAIFEDAKKGGRLSDTMLAHGITDIEYLFPEAKTLTTVPEIIKRDTRWVDKVMGAVHHTPFSRVKSIFADLTEDDARAKGYIKGAFKKEQVFSLLKRTTAPTTVYKKQKLDRDDVTDITDFDVISFIKSEMRVMLDEEIARAVLVGDGRLSSSDDKINEGNVRPIWTDEDLYTIKVTTEAKADDTEAIKSKAFIRAAIKARKHYKGSGEPSLYTNEDVLTGCLLLEDSTGRVIYDSVEKLATALRVKEIVTVPVLEGLTRTNADNNKVTLDGLIVNLRDYNIGADKGGAVNMFDDFDIDYNAMKYLIETRVSGALIKPFSAISIETLAANG